MEWHEKEKCEALKGEYPQVVKYVRECDEDMEMKPMDYVQRWIRSLNVTKKRSEKYKGNDIRQFFGT